jgi:NADPH:quinone reductase-like Zn-dependent oxidoreductase
VIYDRLTIVFALGKLMKYLPTFIGKRPAIAAGDYSGTVLASNSDLFKVGDEVYGIVHSSVKIATGLGSLAEEIVAPADACAKRPDHLDVVSAGGVSLVGLTAVVLARHADASAERVSAGERQRRVLVCGGASSVGMSLVAILHDRGYHVSATCSKAKDQLVRERGADVTFDYRQAGMTDKLIEHVKVHGSFDSILDCADAFDVWQTCDKTLVSGVHR